MSRSKKCRVDRGLLSVSKSKEVAGTYEEHPFFLSLRRSKEMPAIHSFGCHCIPHIGVYGEYYQQCLPMVLLCLPVEKEHIGHQLPQSVLEAIEYQGGGVNNNNKQQQQPVRSQPRPRNADNEATCLVSKSEDGRSSEEGSLWGSIRKCLCCLICNPSERARSGLYSSSYSTTSSSEENGGGVERGDVCSTTQSPPLLAPEQDEDLEVYVTIHPRPQESPCQKFLCDNHDEFNLMYHCWLFPEAQMSAEDSFSQQLSMGVFETSGVKPIHQDLKDAGVTFGRLEERTVCIHNSCFSPENAQMQLSHDKSVVSFFSVARCFGRTVVSFHVVCGTDSVEERLRGALEGFQSLGDLLGWMGADRDFRPCSEVLSKLIKQK